MEQQSVNDILAAISELSVLIQTKVKSKLNRSDDINELGAALSKAQADFEVAGLNRINPYFKSAYADFMSIVGAARPALSKNGLSVTQEISNDDTGALWLITELLHSSGQWKQSRFRMVPPKSDIQAIASYTTYCKRLTYAALLGIVTGDEDDDGEIAVATNRETFAKGVSITNSYNPKELNPETVTSEQLQELEYELQGYHDIAEKILEGLKLQSLADMPKSKWSVSLRRIREIKNLREGK